MPHLAKKYGTTTIDHLIILQPNKIIFDALIALQEKIIIKKIYLVMWEGKLPFYWWSRYARLRDTCKEKNCKIIYIQKKEIILQIRHLNTHPNNIPTRSVYIQMNEFSYPAIHMHGLIDNRPLDIYSAKHKLSHTQKKG